MKLAHFEHDGRRRLGIVTGDAAAVVDLAAAAPDLPTDPMAFLREGQAAFDAAAASAEGTAAIIRMDAVTLLPPVPRPSKFLAIGLNYADHIDESGARRPEVPLFFNKQVSCVTGPGSPIHVPGVSTEVDYEGELGVVIGRRCRHVPAERAHEVIAGYVVVNDVSVRDWQRRSRTMTMGKSFDTHGPTGPWLVTPDEVGDPQALRLTTEVGGEIVQDASTSSMLFGVAAQIEHLTTAFTLEPGDLIATGTPDGVGAARRPPRWLRAGDVCRITIERIGTLENPVIDEPDDTPLL